MIQKFIVLLGLLILHSCSNCDPSTNEKLRNESIAKTAYNNSNFGIYKGILVGSSGIAMININNNGTTNALLTIDGVRLEFRAIEQVTEHQSTPIRFTNNDNSFDFMVGENGENPTIFNCNFKNYPQVKIQVAKEQSSSPIKCYQGRYTGDDAGIFNYYIDEKGGIYGMAKSKYNDDILPLNGSLNSQNSITGTIIVDGEFEGTISSNFYEGSWQKSQENSGIWYAKRTQ
jgi:hypothetical protein